MSLAVFLVCMTLPWRIAVHIDTTAVPKDVDVHRVAFYVGHLTLHARDGRMYEVPGYQLVDTDDTTSLHLRVGDVPPMEYDRVSFVLGIDSADNAMPPQEGPLDPMHGMYWTWATGFIFCKIEGTSARSVQPKQIIEYHIGGYRAPYNNLRRVECALRTPLSATSPISTLHVDVGRFLQHVDPAVVSSVTDPKAGAAIVDHCVEMFHAR